MTSIRAISLEDISAKSPSQIIPSNTIKGPLEALIELVPRIRMLLVLISPFALVEKGIFIPATVLRNKSVAFAEKCSSFLVGSI